MLLIVVCHVQTVCQEVFSRSAFVSIFARRSILNIVLLYIDIIFPIFSVCSSLVNGPYDILVNGRFNNDYFLNTLGPVKSRVEE